MMTPPLKAIALAVAGVMLQTQALAAPTTEQLNSIKLYSDVTIAQDSVTGWGPWTEFEPPAAGNPPLNLPPLTSDLYRPLVQLPELLGFGAFYSVVKTNLGSVSDGQPNPIILTAPRGLPPSNGRLLPDVLNLQMSAITGTYSGLTSVQLSRQEDGSYTNVDNPLRQTQLVLIDLPPPEAPSDVPLPVSIYQLTSYISDGTSTETDLNKVDGIKQTGVIGRTTQIGDIADLRLNNVTATYKGHALLNQGALLAPVSLTVNFGQSTWSGTWNNGQTTSNGAVGFSAGGTISGVQFSSNPGSITALDSNNISGSVRGAFYGAQAAAAAGIADITKNNVRHVDPFIAFKQPAAAVTPTPTVPTGVGSQ